ncbi:hypothetical protein ABZW18_05330 [Streptomyces sp. NPDC004647]|uniref:hypothetical protein n=1 Tax=Streptomyces sp. NPDC004647 TaxID=3154671 RepID=UPI0033ABDB22
MVELDLERVTAWSKEPSRVLPPGAAPSDVAMAARAVVELLAVTPGSGQTPRAMRDDEA